MIRSHTTTEIIAKEGWKYVGLFSVLFLISWGTGVFEWVFLFVLLITIYIFRNPERIPAEDDKTALLAPNDGNISNISKIILQDGREFLKLEIRKSLLNVSLIRAPISSTISNTKRIHGLFLNIEDKLSKKLGEKVVITLKSNSKSIFLIMKAGFFSRSIDLFKSIGPLKFAQRFGLLLDGSIELLLPIDMRIKVSVGDEVRAGESVLGYSAYGSIKDDKQ